MSCSLAVLLARHLSIALASHAKQADDEELMRMATRIRARAVRRAGELLHQLDGRGRPPENTMDTHGISQRQAASDAGMSERQRGLAMGLR